MTCLRAVCLVKFVCLADGEKQRPCEQFSDSWLGSPFALSPPQLHHRHGTGKLKFWNTRYFLSWWQLRFIVLHQRILPLRCSCALSRADDTYGANLSFGGNYHQMFRVQVIHQYSDFMRNNIHLLTNIRTHAYLARGVKWLADQTHALTHAQQKCCRVLTPAAVRLVSGNIVWV